MKKVFKSMIVALSFLSMGMLTTSCEEGGILSQILPNLFGQTETYNYSGTATSECLTGAASTMQWNYINTPTSIKLTAPVTLTVKNSLTTLELPSYIDGKVTMNNVTLYNLAMAASNDQSHTVLSVGESSTIDGSIQIGSTTYTAGTVYITKAQATPESLILDMTIYFAAQNENDYTKAVNFTYNGKIVTE
jgi:hypothetical protein